MKFGTAIHGTLMIHRIDFGDPHVSSGATMSYKCVISSDTCQQLLDGLPGLLV